MKSQIKRKRRNYSNQQRMWIKIPFLRRLLTNPLKKSEKKRKSLTVKDIKRNLISNPGPGSRLVQVLQEVPQKQKHKNLSPLNHLWRRN